MRGKPRSAVLRRALLVGGISIVAISAAFLPIQATPVSAACLSVRPFGDVIGGSVDASDAQYMLRDVVGLMLPLAYCGPEDVDCNGRFDAVDALKVLRYVAGLPYSQVQPCPEIGEIVEH